jgi:hypothetical protein
VAFEIDAALNPGNQGGPVIDREGKVIGIIKGARPGNQRIVVIAVGTVREFLFAPAISYAASFRGEVPMSRRAEPTNVAFLLDLPGAIDPRSVELEVVIEAGPGDRRVFPGKYRRRVVDQTESESEYEATIIPIAPMRRLTTLTVEYRSGAVRGRVADRAIRVGDRELRLAEVNRIELARLTPPQSDPDASGRPAEGLPAGSGWQPLIVLKNPEVIRGRITGLEPLVLDVDGTSIPIDLERATIIDIRPDDRPPAPESVACTVIARLGKSELGRRSMPLILRRSDGKGPAEPRSPRPPNLLDPDGRLELDLTPTIAMGARGAGASIKPPPIPPEGETEVLLGGVIDDLVTGGGGRYLLLVQQAVRRIAVFDVNEARVIGQVPLPSHDALVTAGAEVALVFEPGSSQLETWALPSLARIGSSPFMTGGQVKSITLGCDSAGPLLVHWGPRNDTSGLGSRLVSLVDLDSLRFARFKEAGVYQELGFHPGFAEPGEARMAPAATRARFIPGPLELGGEEGQRLPFRASPGGRLFVTWSVEHVNRTAFSIEKTALEYHQPEARGGHPGPDDATIFALGVLLDASGRRRRDDLPRDQVFLPTNESGTFLGIGGLINPAAHLASAVASPAVCNIYLGGGNRPVVTLDDLNPMVLDVRAIERTDLTIDKRFHYLPAARLLITIPGSNDRLVLRHVDVRDRLRRSGRDYLLVTTRAPATAVRGRAYRYPLGVESPRGGAEYELITGPVGMTVARDGVVSWDVPETFDDDRADVVIQVRDASGQSATHAFHIRVF